MTILNSRTFNESASGIPILAIHCLEGHSKRWSRFAAHFHTRPVIAVDLRGHGHSTFNAPWSLNQHLSDLVETIAAYPKLSGGQFDAIGHSFGGFLSIWLYSRVGSKIRSLVLVDPVFLLSGERVETTVVQYLGDTTFGSREEAMKSMMSALDQDYLVREGYMTEQMEMLRVHPDVEDELRDHLETLGILDSVTRERFRWSPAMAVCAFSEMCSGLPDLRDEIRPRVLLFVATKGNYVQSPQIEAIKTFAGDGNVTVETLECGHLMLWEKLPEICESVERFYELPVKRE
ncbi:Alpha/Beta hydrolase protein [Cladochytrium replicatum]|nr:Alpha/Beta hydrolase protein [Cladochytrium replicatum]